MTVQKFKDFFARDFPFGTDVNEDVLDSDIERALLVTNCKVNPELFCSEDELELAILLLTAHYLVESLKTSSQGLSSKFEWPSQSRSVGSVSASSSIPNKVLDSPEFSYLSGTGYGAMYLSLVYPRIKGQIFSVQGGTRP